MLSNSQLKVELHGILDVLSLNSFISPEKLSFHWLHPYSEPVLLWDPNHGLYRDKKKITHTCTDMKLKHLYNNFFMNITIKENDIKFLFL